MIDNMGDKVKTAVSAVGDGIWSRRKGILLAGNTDRIDEELKEIEEELAAKNTEIRKKNRKSLFTQKNYEDYDLGTLKIEHLTVILWNYRYFMFLNIRKIFCFSEDNYYLCAKQK